MKYFTLISIALVITLLTVSILVPGWANFTAGVTVVVGLLMVLYTVVQKHVRRHKSQPVSKLTTARNIFIETTSILLAMLAAGFLGKVVAEAATSQINDELTKLVTGIFIGVLIGLGTGFLVRRGCGAILGYLLKAAA